MSITNIYSLILSTYLTCWDWYFSLFFSATMAYKAKYREYRSLEHFKSDVQLMVDNSLQFNGKQHEVTKQAEK
jgi:hypothetical protein